MRERKVLREVNLETEEITFTLPDTGESFVAKLNELSEESVKMLVARAVNSSVGNNVPTDGTDRMAAMQKVWENLKTGAFARRGAGGTSNPTIFVEAIMKTTEHDAATVLARLEELTIEEKAEWQKNVKVKAAMQAIRADRARTKAKLSAKEATESGDSLPF